MVFCKSWLGQKLIYMSKWRGVTVIMTQTFNDWEMRLKNGWMRGGARCCHFCFNPIPQFFLGAYGFYEIAVFVKKNDVIRTQEMQKTDFEVIVLTVHYMYKYPLARTSP